MNLRGSKTKSDMSKWSNILNGLPVFILGNGPSIRKQPLDLLDSYFTIGINRIFDLVDPTILFWQDIELIHDFAKKVDQTASWKVCRDVSDPKGKYTNYSLGLDPYRIHYTPQKLWGRGCSGALASQLAISMGAGSIILLGCDCSAADPKGRETDFYGKNKHHKKHTMKNFVKCMWWLRDESPIPIYSTSGSIGIFPTHSLQEIIEIVNPPKMTKFEHISILIT